MMFYWSDSEKAMVAKAAILSMTCHAGQLRKDGLPYFVHPLRVAEAVGDNGAVAAAVALLHDVIEDTMHTGDDLRKLGVPAAVVDRVQMLTHAKDADYAAYIAGLVESGDYIAMRVKLADIRDNLADGIVSAEKKVKYGSAVVELRKAIGGGFSYAL
jgi:(p)ppGpp synthase/HD superfamily hydrolase